MNDTTARAEGPRAARAEAPGAAYGALLALSGLLGLATLATLLPWPAARWPSILGYRAFCSFAPLSTALCALLAMSVCVIRNRLFGPRRGERRSWIAPIAVALALIACIGIAAPAYAKAKTPADGISSSSLSKDR